MATSPDALDPVAAGLDARMHHGGHGGDGRAGVSWLPTTPGPVVRAGTAPARARVPIRRGSSKRSRPLSELASALGMRYVFAESWAPEYGNSVLSRWPIKRWKVLRVADHYNVRYVRPPYPFSVSAFGLAPAAAGHVVS